MSSLTQGPYWLGNDLLTSYSIRVWPPMEGCTWGAQGLWSRPLGAFKMNKMTTRPQGSTAVWEQSTPYIQEENMKTCSPLRSKRSVKVRRTHPNSSCLLTLPLKTPHSHPCLSHTPSLCTPLLLKPSVQNIITLFPKSMPFLAPLIFYRWPG